MKILNESVPKKVVEAEDRDVIYSVGDCWIDALYDQYKGMSDYEVAIEYCDMFNCDEEDLPGYKSITDDDIPSGYGIDNVLDYRFDVNEAINDLVSSINEMDTDYNDNYAKKKHIKGHVIVYELRDFDGDVERFEILESPSLYDIAFVNYPNSAMWGAELYFKDGDLNLYDKNHDGSSNFIVRHFKDVAYDYYEDNGELPDGHIDEFTSPIRKEELSI